MKDNGETTPQLLWPTSKTAAAVSLQPQTLRVMRSNGTGPMFCKIGNRALYDPNDVASWIESHKRRSTSDPGPGPGRAA